MTNTVHRLRSQYDPELLGVGAEPVRLSWQVTGTGSQRAAELQMATDPTFASIEASAVVESDEQIAVAAPGPAPASRAAYYYRVRVDTGDEWTPWSETVTVEAGLVSPADWVADAIALPDDGAERPGPSPYHRVTFDCPAAGVRRARLYVTSHGAHQASVNGVAVATDLLAPGWTSYERRLLACAYDVTALLGPGRNALGIVLGDAWFRGRLGWEPSLPRAHYGTTLAVLAQLEIEHADGTTQIVASGPQWRSSTGAIVAADIYDGCTLDLGRAEAGWNTAGFDDRSWVAATVVALDTSVVEPWRVPPIRPIERRPVSTSRTSPTTWRVDVGQNISGYLELDLAGAPGDEVVVRHAEVLEPDGALHVRSLRTAKATDRYTLADPDETRVAPAFTFHGFRYADVETAADLRGVTAVAISTALAERARFHCSHEALNQLVANVRWSQRDNFVGVPTDCPQRDERLGWTGDAQAFAATANTLLDCYQFWSNWLIDLALDQTDDGVTSVVPHVVLDGEASVGRAGWADAATIVPFAAFQSYGDAEVLRRQLPSMQRWVATLRAKARADGLLGGEFQFGDWLDPDAPPAEPWKAKVDADFVANAYFAHSARLTAHAATVLGDSAVADEHHRLADDIAARTWARWRDHAAESQTGCALALQFDLAPVAEQPALADRLRALVESVDGAVATGFLGTPLVLPALTRFGHLDAAYLMLLRRDAPSWLYQVDRGATTVWERWDALRRDGSIHPGDMEAIGEGATADGTHMLSFNHYAYGAVVDWIITAVGGLAPAGDGPGYRRALVAPRPCVDVTSASTAIDTPYGTLALDWALDGTDLDAELTVPFGVTALLDLPASSDSVATVDGDAATGDTVGPGRHHIRVTNARVATGARAATADPHANPSRTT